MSRFEIIDNFLSEEDWQKQYDLFFSTEHIIKWNFHEVKHQPDSYFFQHMFQKHRIYDGSGVEKEAYSRKNPVFISPMNSVSKNHIKHYDIALEPILKHYPHKELLSARTNLFTRMSSNFSFEKPDPHGVGLHTDHGGEFHYLTMIYYINTTNGGTYFANDKGAVQSIKNRLVVFDGHTFHRHIYQTDEKARVATNINIIV